MANLPDLWRRGSMWGESPFRELNRMQRQIDRMFEDLIPSTSGTPSMGLVQQQMWNPTCDVVEKNNHFILSFDLPGVKKEDIQIDLRNDVLTVSGQRREEYEEEREKGAYRSEKFYGTFSRSFTLPSGIKPEQVQADYKDGVLHVAIPKIEAAQAHQVKIGEKPGFFDRLLGKKEEPSGKVRVEQQRPGEKAAS